MAKIKKWQAAQVVRNAAAMAAEVQQHRGSKFRHQAQLTKGIAKGHLLWRGDGEDLGSKGWRTKTNCLVGQGKNPSEKYDFVNWDDEINPIFLGK